MSNGDPLPDEIVLTLHEAAQVLFALDEGIELAPDGSDAKAKLEDAARLLTEKFLPDLPDL